MQSHIKRLHGRYTKVDAAKVLDELHKIRDARFCVYFFEKSQLKCETLFLKKLETPVTAAVIKSESQSELEPESDAELRFINCVMTWCKQRVKLSFTCFRCNFLFPMETSH